MNCLLGFLAVLANIRRYSDWKPP